MSRLQLVTGPTSEPVTLAEQKLHSRVDISNDDDYISALIVACRQFAELYQNRALLTQTWRLMLDYFPAVIHVPNPPLRTVTSIQYLDPATGTFTTLSSSAYVVATDGAPGLIYPVFGTQFPVPQSMLQSVKVTYTAGYDIVPQATKAAIMMMVDHLYRNRSAVSDVSMSEVPMGCKGIQPPNRRERIQIWEKKKALNHYSLELCEVGMMPAGLNKWTLWRRRAFASIPLIARCNCNFWLAL